jgi:hypothetical protein
VKRQEAEAGVCATNGMPDNYPGITGVTPGPAGDQFSCADIALSARRPLTKRTVSRESGVKDPRSLGPAPPYDIVSLDKSLELW